MFTFQSYLQFFRGTTILISSMVEPACRPTSSGGVLFLRILSSICSLLSFWSEPFWLVWDRISGLFGFAFPWWLRMLNIFRCFLDIKIPLLWVLCLALYSIFYLGCLCFWKLTWVLLYFGYEPSVGCRLSKDICPNLQVAHLVYFRFMRSHLSTVDLRAWATGVLFRKFPTVPMSMRLFLNFCSMERLNETVILGLPYVPQC